MSKVKAGTLKPIIAGLKKELAEKKDALAGPERRQLVHRLKRTQRKARRIRTEDERRGALVDKAGGKAAAGAAPPAEATTPEAPPEGESGEQESPA